MKNILLIQFRVQPEVIEAERRNFEEVLGETVNLTCALGFEAGPQWDDPTKLSCDLDAVILGGSGDFDLDGGRAVDDSARVEAHSILERMRPLIDHVLEHEVPTFGICFGHQLIAQARGTSVVCDPAQKKAASHEVRTSPEGRTDPLFADMPEVFFAQYGHKDSLSCLPSGAVLLGSGPNCRFSALRYGNTCYTMQFHPELSAEAMLWRLPHLQELLPKEIDLSTAVRPSPEAASLLEKFVEKIVRDQK